MKFGVIGFWIYLLFIARYSSAQNWEKFYNGSNDHVLTFYNDSVSGKLYIGGSFTQIGNCVSRGIMSWDGLNLDSLQSGLDIGDAPNFVGRVLAIERFQNKLYVGGSFHSIGSINSKWIGTWDGLTWDSIPGSVNSVPLTLRSLNNELYVGGSFDSVSGFPANGIAKWDGTSWATVNNFPNFNAHLNGENLISSIESFQGNLYVAGNFEGQNGRKEITYWNGTVWAALDNGILGSAAWVNCMKVYHNELYVAGHFYHSDGNVGNSIMKWNGVQWSDVNQGVSGQVDGMLIYNDDLYVTGYFSQAGNIPCSNIAKWNGTEWCSLSGQFDNTVSAIGEFNDSIFVGGGFWTIDTDSMYFISKWIGGNHTDSCGNLISNINNEVSNSISIYPNPIENKFIIQSLKYHIEEVKIYDSLGKKMASYLISGEQSLIDFENYPAGVYQVVVTSKEGNVIERIVKR